MRWERHTARIRIHFDWKRSFKEI